MAVGNSDLCPIGDFGVALQCDVAYQVGRGPHDGAIGILLTPDKQAFRMILYLGSRRNDLISIHPVDGYHKGVSCDGSITGGDTGRTYPAFGMDDTTIYVQICSTTDPCSSGSNVISFCPYGSQGAASS